MIIECKLYQTWIYIDLLRCKRVLPATTDSTRMNSLYPNPLIRAVPKLMVLHRITQKVNLIAYHRMFLEHIMELNHIMLKLTVQTFLHAGFVQRHSGGTTVFRDMF